MSAPDQLASFLDLAVAPPATEPSWEDVLRRTRQSRQRRVTRRNRRLLAAAVAVGVGAAIAASPLGGSIVKLATSAIAGLTDWTDGSPGEPADLPALTVFDEQRENAPFGFSQAPLRLLATAMSEGMEFRLYGFRVGDAVCLRLTSNTYVRDLPATCLPRSTIEAGQDVVPIVVDFDYTPRQPTKMRPIESMPQADVSFGFAKDGVAAVEITRSNGTRSRARAQANAYLHVQPLSPSDPMTATAEIVALHDDGTRSVIDFVPSLGVRKRLGPPAGPRALDRLVLAGPIDWIERREARGEPLPFEADPETSLGIFGEPLFARMIRPSASTDAAMYVAVGRDVGGSSGRTMITVGVLRALNGAEAAFGLLPGSWLHVFGGGGTSRRFGGDQFVTVAGSAADEVRRMLLYPAGGGVPFEIPLRDNVWISDVPRTMLPGNLVALDAEGNVIGLFAGFGDDGGTGMPSAQLGGEWKPPPLSLELQPPSGRDHPAVIVGRVTPEVARVEIRFADGSTSDIPVAAPEVRYTLSGSELRRALQVATIVALDASGGELAQQELLVARDALRR